MLSHKGTQNLRIVFTPDEEGYLISVHMPGASGMEEATYTATFSYKDQWRYIQHKMTTEGVNGLIPWLPIGTPEDWFEMILSDRGEMAIDLAIDRYDFTPDQAYDHDEDVSLEGL